MDQDRKYTKNSDISQFETAENSSDKWSREGEDGVDVGVQGEANSNGEAEEKLNPTSPPTVFDTVDTQAWISQDTGMVEPDAIICDSDMAGGAIKGNQIHATSGEALEGTQ